jgi:hypothetical protein
MNIEGIDRMEFLSWMKRISDRLDILSELVRGNEKYSAIDEGDQLLDKQDVLQMLKISGRSLQRYREKGTLPYYMIGGKQYYRLSDVRQFVRDHCITPVKIKK